MRVRLTEKFLAALALKEGSHPDVNDTILRGLQIRKSKRGISGYAVGRLRGGRPVPIRLLIGKYPDMRLAELRAGADKLLRDLRTGIHPRQREAEQRRAKAAQLINTLDAVAREFIQRHAAQKRTGRWIERRIERELISRWGDWTISEVTRRDVVTMVDEIVDRGHPEAARQTLAYGRRLFSWAIARGVYGIEHSPFDRARGGDLIGPKKLRQRMPSDRELVLIWSASFDIPRGDYVQLLQLLGMRRCELSEAVWSEFDLDRSGQFRPIA
jgi:Phage integrase central domain/Arm DNA-binding domain